MKKIFIMLFALCVLVPFSAHAQLISYEGVDAINEAWDDLADGAEKVTDTVKEGTKNGLKTIDNAYESVKGGVVNLKNDVFYSNRDDDDRDDDDDRFDDDRDDDRDDDDDDDDDDGDDNDDDDDDDDDDDNDRDDD